MNGEILTNDNKNNFYDQVKNNIKEKIYPTTDHLITVLKITFSNGDLVIFIYVSLDNSIRANKNGHPLFKRLDNICGLINKVIKSCSEKCVVFFSEACRNSYEMENDVVLKTVSWLSIRKYIMKKCNLEFVAEKRNNDGKTNLSFGGTCLCTSNMIQEFESDIENSSKISEYYTVSTLDKEFGSVAIGVKVCDKIIWAIHFPIDFRNKGEENLGL